MSTRRDFNKIVTVSGYTTLGPDPGPGTYEITVHLLRYVEEKSEILHTNTLIIENAHNRPNASAAAQLEMRKLYPSLLGYIYTQVETARWIAKSEEFINVVRDDSRDQTEVQNTVDSSTGMSATYPDGLFYEDGIWFTADGLFYEGPTPTAI